MIQPTWERDGQTGQDIRGEHQLQPEEDHHNLHKAHAHCVADRNRFISDTGAPFCVGTGTRIRNLWVDLKKNWQVFNVGTRYQYINLYYYLTPLSKQTKSRNRIRVNYLDQDPAK